MPLSKSQKEGIKLVVNNEKRHRADHESISYLLHSRLSQRQCEEKGFKVMLLNKSPINTDHMSTEDIAKICENLEESIKYSRWKQKAYTYIFNGDKENAIKYGDKMKTYFYEREEKISENPQSFRIHIDNEINRNMFPEDNLPDESYTGQEEGLRRYCDEFKSCYDLREGLIKVM